jgi:predicted nucleic acid-binding protein
MDYLTDTTFLVDLWRERGKPSRALDFVDSHERVVVGVPWVAKGEFLRGALLAGHANDAVRRFLDSFLVIWPTEETLYCYAGVYGALRKSNALIGPNDLWIAACAVQRRLPLLTRNVGEFCRVEGLTVVDYTRS